MSVASSVCMPFPEQVVSSAKQDNVERDDSSCDCNFVPQGSKFVLIVNWENNSCQETEPEWQQSRSIGRHRYCGYRLKSFGKSFMQCSVSTKASNLLALEVGEFILIFAIINKQISCWQIGTESQRQSSWESMKVSKICRYGSLSQKHCYNLQCPRA